MPLKVNQEDGEVWVSLTHMLKVKFIIHLVMHVMVKNNMLQTR